MEWWDRDVEESVSSRQSLVLPPVIPPSSAFCRSAACLYGRKGLGGPGEGGEGRGPSVLAKGKREMEQGKGRAGQGHKG